MDYDNSLTPPASPFACDPTVSPLGADPYYGAADYAAACDAYGAVDAAAYLLPDLEYPSPQGSPVASSLVTSGCDFSPSESLKRSVTPANSNSWDARPILASPAVEQTGLEDLEKLLGLPPSNAIIAYYTTQLSIEHVSGYTTSYGSQSAYHIYDDGAAIAYASEFQEHYHARASGVLDDPVCESLSSDTSSYAVPQKHDMTSLAMVQPTPLPSSIAPSILCCASTSSCSPPVSPILSLDSVTKRYDVDVDRPSLRREHASKAGRESRYEPYPLPSCPSNTGGSAIKGVHKSVAERKEAPSRHLQVDEDGEVVLLPPKDSMQCTVCPYKQTNDRRPDLIRHILTHYPKQYRCGGIPVELARALGLTTWDKDTERMCGETLYVGGCLHGFSRRDALNRHLRNERGCCFGDLNAPYQPPLKRARKGAKVFAIGWFGEL